MQRWLSTWALPIQCSTIFAEIPASRTAAPCPWNMGTNFGLTQPIPRGKKSGAVCIWACRAHEKGSTIRSRDTGKNASPVHAYVRESCRGQAHLLWLKLEVCCNLCNICHDLRSRLSHFKGSDGGHMRHLHGTRFCCTLAHTLLVIEQYFKASCVPMDAFCRMRSASCILLACLLWP